jgi:hypothetical protein
MPPAIAETGGPQVGRVAATDRRSERLNLDPGLFSVVLAVPAATAALQPSSGTRGAVTDKEYTMAFYRAKADALDESSHLQGRTEDAGTTSARRSRAVGGVINMTMRGLGGLGIGRVAEQRHSGSAGSSMSGSSRSIE